MTRVPGFAAGLSKGEGRELGSEIGLCERELDLEMAEMLPYRETLGIPAININLVIAPNITIQTGVAIATQVLSPNSSDNALCKRLCPG